jgi:hypothetical protein
MLAACRGSTVVHPVSPWDEPAVRATAFQCIALWLAVADGVLSKGDAVPMDLKVALTDAGSATAALLHLVDVSWDDPLVAVRHRVKSIFGQLLDVLSKNMAMMDYDRWTRSLCRQFLAQPQDTKARFLYTFSAFCCVC